jgi:hypothetical protein
MTLFYDVGIMVKAGYGRVKWSPGSPDALGVGAVMSASQGQVEGEEGGFGA